MDEGSEYVPENDMIEVSQSYGKPGKVGRTKCKILVDSIRRYEGDTADMVRELNDGVSKIKDDIEDFNIEPPSSRPLFSVKIETEGREAYDIDIDAIKGRLEYQMKEALKLSESLIENDDTILIDKVYYLIPTDLEKDISFKRSYVSPNLSVLEKEHIRID